MNVFLLLSAVFVLFIAVDILTAKLFKLKRTLIRNISFVLLCVFALSSGIGGGLTLIRTANTSAKTLYNSYSYLLAGNIDKATENAAKVNSPHSDIIVLLADCLRGNYASAFINSDDLKNSGELNNDLSVQADNIYNLSRQMTGLEGTAPTIEVAHEQLTDIAKTCFSLLKVSEKSEVEFLSGFKRDNMINSDNFYEVDSQTLHEMLLQTPDDKELLRYSVKYFNAVGGLDVAEEKALRLLKEKKSVDNIVLYTDVIAQKLLTDTNITNYDEKDKEIAKLLKKAADSANAAEVYEEGNPRRDENLAKAEEYRKQANGVKAKRIINWLIAESPLFGDNSGVIDLQLSKLYTAAGNDAKARGKLLGLLKREDRISDSSPIKSALVQLGNVYNDANASDEDIAAAISAMSHIDAFLPDSVLNRGYSEFLNNMLKYERTSIFISRVDSANYPTVRAYLNVNGKKNGVDELANDFTLRDFTFADNGFGIDNSSVKRIEDDSSNLISIALVVDGSGSMQGSRIENARRAVSACVNNLVPETQELSIVMYDDAVEILSPLTNDVSKLRSGADRIMADGGTNIPSGLLGGIESLKDAKGTKAIILMTDGEDGNAGEMPGAIEAAQAENIAVFTVSTGGGNREYMENIALKTGGTYMEALTDNELVNVYMALQSYIVNNYCFEYTVIEDAESNPRVLTVGLKDYETESSRTYGYGDLILTKDGSYITRGDSSSLSLLYSEPSVVSVKDAQLGVPVFISGSGIADGAKLFINGNEINDAKTVGGSVISFTLNGKYKAGALNITVKLPNGTSRSSDKLLAVSGTGGTAEKKTVGQTITLGSGGNTLYADDVEQKDEYTLKLSGNVILNGFLHTSSAVIIQSNSPIMSGGGRLTVRGGSISGSGAAYVDFSSPKDANANYGQLAFGGGSAKILDSFSFSFDEYGVNLDYANSNLSLPGFGEIYGDAKFINSEIIITATGGYALSELQANLNYALNRIPLPKNGVSSAVQTIMGYSQQNQNQYVGSSNYGFYANGESITVTVKKDFMSISGTGTLRGYLGSIDISDGKLTIDTDNSASMFGITGTAQFYNMKDTLGVDGQTPITIVSAGFYPDTITLNATGLSINGAGLSECFTSNNPPKALECKVKVNYPLSVDDEPYKGQVSSLLGNVVLNCDRIEFSCENDRNQNGIKVYNSKKPEQYIKFLTDGAVIPINDIDELSMFGSDLGGEISGEATISYGQINLNIDVDGHLDNNYLGIKHDGKATLTAVLPRNAYGSSSIPVSVSYDDKTLSYNATVAGNINPQDGFNTYAEDNG